MREERQTRATETVEDLIDWKNNIQWAPTIPPVKNNFIKVSRLTLKLVLLNLKYKNKVTKAIKTRYQTKLVAEIEINAPNIPVNPQTKTVQCNMTRFLLMAGFPEIL